MKVSFNALHSVPFVAQTQSRLGEYSIQFMRNPYAYIPTYTVNEATALSYVPFNFLSQVQDRISSICGLDNSYQDRNQESANYPSAAPTLENPYPLPVAVEERNSDIFAHEAMSSFHASLINYNSSNEGFLDENSDSGAEQLYPISKVAPTVVYIEQHLRQDVDITQHLAKFLADLEAYLSPPYIEEPGAELACSKQTSGSTSSSGYVCSSYKTPDYSTGEQSTGEKSGAQPAPMLAGGDSKIMEALRDMLANSGSLCIQLKPDTSRTPKPASYPFSGTKKQGMRFLSLELAKQPPIQGLNAAPATARYRTVYYVNHEIDRSGLQFGTRKKPSDEWSVRLFGGTL